MGAVDYMSKAPIWGNPIDTDLDKMRDTLNYLLLGSAQGALMLPGWNTQVTPNGVDYAQPTGVVLTRGTRQIRISYTWTDGVITAYQFCYNDGVSSPGLVCFAEQSIQYGPAGLTVTAKSFNDGSSPWNYYKRSGTVATSPKPWDGGLIASGGSGQTWQNLTVVFCIYPVAHGDDDKIFIFGSGQSVFTIATNDKDGGMWISTVNGSNVVKSTTIAATGSPSDFGGLDPGEWHAVMISFEDLGSTMGIEVWIDGVEKVNATHDSTSDQMRPMDYTGPCYVGVGDFRFGSAPGADPDLWEGLECYLSYVWADDTYLDPNTYWSTFFDANNKPQDIGTNGENPTGSTPQTYCPNGDFTDNKGTQGNWTEVGSVPNAPSSPSD